jgi:hypothetical protein
MGYFKNKRKSKEEKESLAREAVARKIAEETFEVGLNGSVETFMWVWAAESNNNIGRPKLQEGAIQAFLEKSHPEKIQFMLSNPDKFDVNVAAVLLSLTRGKESEQAVALIKLALEKVSEEKMLGVLDNALLKHVYTVGDEPFVKALLLCGADANGDKGRVFARAIVNCSFPVIKLLHDKGGKFEDALAIMQDEVWRPYENCNAKLRFYQNKVLIEQLQQNISDLTESNRVLTERVNGLIDRLEGVQPGEKPASAPQLRASSYRGIVSQL